MSIINELKKQLCESSSPVVEEIVVSLIPEKKQIEFTNDIIKSIEAERFSYNDVGVNVYDYGFPYINKLGESHPDGSVKVVGHKTAVTLTPQQINDGWKRETLLICKIPKGSAISAMKAIHEAVIKFGFTTERVFRKEPEIVYPPNYMGLDFIPQTLIGANFQTDSVPTGDNI